MADNVTLDSGTGGSTIRTDDDGTAHWQYIKVAYGADNTRTIVGSISSNPFPVALSATDNAVLDNIQTAVELVDNTVAVLGTATYTEATTSGNVIGVVRNDTLATLASADNEIAPLQVDAAGALYVQEGSALDCSGATLTVASHAVTNTGTFAVQIVDTSFAVADGNTLGEGVLVQGDDGTDRKNINVDATTGDVQVDITHTVTVDLGANNDVTLNANDGVDIGDVDVASVAGTVTIGGVAAHDAAVSGNPILLGAEARTTIPAQVADGDVVRLMADDHGRLCITPYSVRELTTHNHISPTDTEETTLIAAHTDTTVYRDLVFLSLSNSSASEALVQIRDAASGTIRLVMDLAADGGGAVLSFPVPLKQAASGTAWVAEVTSAVSKVYMTAETIDVEGG